MTDSPSRTDVGPPSRGWGVRFRLTTLIGLVAACAVGLAGYARHRASNAPWERAGGMIGWSRAAIESSLGPPDKVIEGDAPDEHAQRIRLRPKPPGTFRTLVFQTFDGTFVAWMRSADGAETCFGSSWVEKGRYY